MAANVQSQYTHVWVTIQQVWFNTSDTATPADDTWEKFTLTEPITVDLAALTNGTLRRIADNLELPEGTYQQIRLVALDETTALTAAADDEGAEFNSEAEFIDSAGKTRNLPLELLNPAAGIGVRTSFKVKSSSSVESTPDDLSLVFAFGMQDLVQFDYGSELGLLLNPHAVAYEASAAGTISGTIDLANVGGSGRRNVAVTAEIPASDNTRHVAVRTAPVAADGSFVLYPLPTDAASYDLVIHGPGIATVVIKSVPASTSGTAVGTVPVRAATSFKVNLEDEDQEFPPGALIGFYQTLQAGELPYLIDEVQLDPFSRTFFADHPLSRDTVDSGTYVADGNVTLSAVTPVQGAGVYALAARASRFKDGALAGTVTAPISGTGTVKATLAALEPLAGSDSSSLTLRVSALDSNKYDHGQLIVSQDGGIIQTLALDSALTRTGGATLTLDNLPAGADEDFYYVSVRAWNSDDPEETRRRLTISIPLDLRDGEISTTLPLVIN